jgi:hypothetical protein
MMANGYQVIKFVLADFDQYWTRNLLPDTVVEYTAVKAGANLAVVFEGATGVMTTYRYKLQPRDVVHVVGQVIHIPARCLKQEPGDTVKCRG